jgi:AAA+ ATPase superfamily predicted ATPase
VPNPFTYGGRITNPAQFIGRTKELQTIFSALETAHSGQLQHVQIVGPRRIGKSSLLYHVTQIYRQRLTQSEKYRFVYVDLDDARCHTLEGLLKYISSQLGLSNKPTLDKFQEAIEELSREQGIYPILCLDEFEHLTKRKDQFPNDVFEVWRSLASGSKLAFVTASQTSLGQLIQQGNLTSTFHNIFIYLELGNFTEPEARMLLARNTDRPFSEEEISKLFKLAGYHPAHLQIAAQLLYEAKANRTVNWAELKAEYEKRVKQIKPFALNNNQPSLLQRILRSIFIEFPTALGRFILDLLKNKDASDRTAAILGWATIILLLLILLGIITLPVLEPWIRLVLPSSS